MRRLLFLIFICSALLHGFQVNEDSGDEKPCDEDDALEQTTTSKIAFQTAQQILPGQNGFGASPFRLTEPGNYVLIDNLVIPPPSQTSPQNGITIDADNVILDLNSQTITGLSFSGNAIFVTNNHANITIRNGIIRFMGQNGIFVNAGCRLITLENILFINNNTAATLVSVRTGLIDNCFAALHRASGFLITQSGPIASQSITITNCNSSFNNGDGFQLANCFNFQIADCLAHNNNGNGFNQTNGDRITFNNTQVHNNGLSGFFSSGNNHTFNECQSNNNGTSGFFIAGNEQNIDQCDAKANNTDGFIVNGNNTVITDCTSINNNLIGYNISGNRQTITRCEGTGNTTGFQITNNNHCVLNCIAKGNDSFGMLLLANSQECQIRDNTATANGTGIQNNTTTINRIYSNFSSNNTLANFVGVPNVSVSPGILTPINCTANIEN